MDDPNARRAAWIDSKTGVFTLSWTEVGFDIQKNFNWKLTISINYSYKNMAVRRLTFYVYWEMLPYI